MATISTGTTEHSQEISEIAYTSSDEIEYLGFADGGSATSEAVWKIQKFTWTSGLLARWKLADGNDRRDNVWDNRASLSFS